MKIGLDARTLFEKRSGIGVYTLNLIKSLARIDPNSKYILYTAQDQILPNHLGYISNIEKRSLFTPKFLPDFMWYQGLLPISLILKSVDLFHGLDFFAPIAWSGKTIITVPDLSFELFPDDFPLKTRFNLQKLTPICCKRANKIITISENTKKDLIRYYHVPNEKIEVIYLGVDHRVYRPLDRENAFKIISKKYNISQNFILIVGDLRPRKNLLRVLKAFLILRKTRKIEYQMVIIGKKLWGISRIFRFVKNHCLDNQVLFPGYISDVEMPLFYNAAILFIHPSLYEGFGLAPLEAMSCGTPVAVSNISSLPEVCNDAAMYFDPYSSEEIANVIYTILIDKSLQQSLQSKGIERSKEFCWEDTARKTLRVYSQVL